MHIDILNSSAKLENTIVFAYLLYLLEHKNTDSFEELQENINEPLQDEKVFPTAVHRRITFAWRKLEDIITGRRRMVRIEKVMQEYFKEFNQSFLDLVFSFLLPNEADREITEPAKLLEKIADVQCIRVHYFELA